MIGFLWRLIVGRFTSCRHDWEEIEVIKQRGPYGIHVGVRLKCKHCGKQTIKTTVI